MLSTLCLRKQKQITQRNLVNLSFSDFFPYFATQSQKTNAKTRFAKSNCDNDKRKRRGGGQQGARQRQGGTGHTTLRRPFHKPLE